MSPTPPIPGSAPPCFCFQPFLFQFSTFFPVVVVCFLALLTTLDVTMPMPARDGMEQAMSSPSPGWSSLSTLSSPWEGRTSEPRLAGCTSSIWRRTPSRTLDRQVLFFSCFLVFLFLFFCLLLRGPHRRGGLRGREGKRGAYIFFSDLFARAARGRWPLTRNSIHIVNITEVHDM